MDCRTVFPGEIPQDLDPMVPQRNTVYALGRLLIDLLLNETNPSSNLYPTLVSGFKPSFPGGFVITLDQGSIFSLQNTDGSWGTDLAADTRQIIQQGLANAQNLNFAAAPGVGGQSRIDLVQVKYQQIDDGAQVNLYYNSSNPAQPLLGPNGTGTTDNVNHRNAAVVAIKQGVAGTPGVAPTADAGYTPLFQVTLTNGMGANIAAGNCVVHASAPFLAGLTSQHHTGAPGSAPKIDLTAEVTGALPWGNVATPTSVVLDAGLPAAGVAYRNQIRIVDNSTAAPTLPDTIKICLRLADNSYDWVQFGPAV